MPRSEMSDAFAETVVTAGITAASMSLEAGLDKSTIITLLTEGLMGDNMAVEGVLNLLAVALIRLAEQFRDLNAMGQQLLELVALAHEKGVISDEVFEGVRAEYGSE